MGGLIAGSMQAKAAEKAAKIQAESAEKAMALQKEMYDTTRSDMMPWLDAGRGALGNLQQELGLTDGRGFTETPGYQFRVAEGTKGVLNSLSALGMKNSGKALKSLETFRQGIASDEYNTWLNRVAGVAGAGQAQSNSLGQVSANAGNNMAQQINNAGAARASGYVGAANAMAGGVNSAFNALGNIATMGMGGGAFPAAPSMGGLY